MFFKLYLQGQNEENYRECEKQPKLFLSYRSKEVCIYTKNKKQEREKMKEEGVDDAMEDKGVGKVGGCSGRESDGLNDTCTLGRGWSRTELDHDD